VIAGLGELEALQDEWAELLAASATDTPMLGPAWLLAWWHTFGSLDGRKLRIWVFRANGRLVGLVPMHLRWFWHWGVLPMRRLELLGSGEQEKDEIVSEYLAPIAAVGYEDAVVDAFVKCLAADPSGWHEILLSQLAAEAPTVAALDPAFRAAGWSCEVRIQAHCPFIKLPARWGDYLSSLESANRYFVNRTQRDFAAWAGDAWRVERVTTKADLERGREILRRLHQQRWENAGEPGVFSSSLFSQFHNRVLPRLLDEKALDLCWLSVRDRPVAVAYNIIWRNRVFFYQGGRATDVPKQVRPGIVLHLEAIKHSIAEGRQEYDFLAGDVRYKTQLATSTRTLVGMRIVRPSLAEAVRRLLETGRTFLREARQSRKSAG